MPSGSRPSKRSSITSASASARLNFETSSSAVSANTDTQIFFSFIARALKVQYECKRSYEAGDHAGRGSRNYSSFPALLHGYGRKAPGDGKRSKVIDQQHA